MNTAIAKVSKQLVLRRTRPPISISLRLESWHAIKELLNPPFSKPSIQQNIRVIFYLGDVVAMPHTSTEHVSTPFGILYPHCSGCAPGMASTNAAVQEVASTLSCSSPTATRKPSSACSVDCAVHYSGGMGLH